MVDRSNWTIGESVISSRTYFPTGFMRDMSNPHNGGRSIDDASWQPAHVSEMYLGTDDRGGVHVNNSIPAHAFYTYATATSKERAEKVFYRALTDYLTPTSKFIDLRKAVLSAAKDLGYGGDVAAIENAFNRVGIVDDVVENKPPADLPANPGQQELLVMNTDRSDPNHLYRISNNYQRIDPVRTSRMISLPENVPSRPSVTDDGKTVYFVDSRNNVKQLVLASQTETSVISDGDNKTVAVSRDGRRLAVVTPDEENPLIWVGDIATGNQRWFKIYNPTTGTGNSKSGGPRYVDAIEFDHTGEYILFDCFNLSGKSIKQQAQEYWDIGLIKVWDNSRNDFDRQGEVVKLFSDLTPGVNVFNPTFSKNSPFIIAFDYYDDEDGYFTLCMNIATGDIDGFENTCPSYPSYSMDDRSLAITAYEDREYNVYYLKLGSDKITVTGEEDYYCMGAACPVYYGTGTRQMGVKPVASFTSDARSGGTGMRVQFVDMSSGNPTSWRWTFQGGSPASSAEQHPKITYNTLGTYPVSLTATNSAGSNELVKQGFITISAVGVEYVEQPAVAVYPNPADDYVLVAGVGLRSVTLFDLTGKTLATSFTADGSGTIRVPLTALRPGVYIMRITLADGTLQTHKLVKK
jgi:PKD repeat protein